MSVNGEDEPYPDELPGQIGAFFTILSQALIVENSFDHRST